MNPLPKTYGRARQVRHALAQGKANWKWSKQRENAALLSSDGKLTEQQIAQTVGVARRTLHRWRQHPAYSARIAKHCAAHRKQIRTKGIAARTNRIAELSHELAALEQIEAERARIYGTAKFRDVIAGGASGLIIISGWQTIVNAKTGEKQKLPLVRSDVSTIKRKLAILKKVEQELGQWLKTTETPDGFDEFIEIIEHGSAGQIRPPEDTAWQWNKKREDAAFLSAEGKLSEEEIARSIGATRRTLHRWRHHPAFRARIEEHRTAYRKQLDMHDISVVENRLAILERMYTMLKQIEAERARIYGTEELRDRIPGGATGGVFIPRYQTIVDPITGKNQSVPIATVDVRIIDAKLAILKRVGQESGQWPKKGRKAEGTDRLWELIDAAKHGPVA
jgi:DNA-binding XRE family transcriptional regulator